MKDKKITEVAIPEFTKNISKSSKICTLGSCFSGEIGQKMKNKDYDILVNPFGVLYNPISIATSISYLHFGIYFELDDVVERDPHYGRKKNLAPYERTYTSFYHHGSFSRSTPKEFLHDANDELKKNKAFFKEADTIFITFGTNVVYRHIEKNIIVSNCHKHLASDFIEEKLSINDIVSAYVYLIKKIPNKKWIFTVSPIRYKKYGLHGSQLSKSILLLAIDELVKRFDNCYYFPSYEIVLDELRDYSYYKDDLCHPNEKAIDYIAEKVISI